MYLNLPRHRHLPPATWRVRTGHSVRICNFNPSELVMQQNLEKEKKENSRENVSFVKGSI